MNDKEVLNRDRCVDLLECTLRDGSYSVDFQFTDTDTRLLVEALSKLGFGWIEVGHGLGLGAAEAGKGTMPVPELQIISAAKSVAGTAKIGVFCIPGLAKLDDLRRARDAGLDFVRVGQNAPESESALPFLREAMKIGLVPAMNFMKSYAVTAREFGERAVMARDAGAEIIYLVDSVGGMMPKDIVRYLEEVKKRCECDIGFHGHDNLRLAVANCLTAFDCGARFLDTTLYGVGRGSGNAPTEVLAALFDNMGVSTGVDVMKLLDVAEAYFWPLMARFNVPDVLSVAMGYGQFHSSFFPKVMQAARKHGADPKRLVVAMGRRDPVHLDEDELERVSRRLAGTLNDKMVTDLISFAGPEFSDGRINTSMDAVKNLAASMYTASAKKRGARTVLELAPTPEPEPGLVVPEFVHEDGEVVVGRVIFGDAKIAEQIADACGDWISLFLLNVHDGWATDLERRIAGKLGRRALPFDSDRAYENVLLDALGMARCFCGNGALLVVGGKPSLWRVINAGHRFRQAMLWSGQAGGETPSLKNLVRINEVSDLQGTRIRFDAQLVLRTVSSHEAHLLDRLLRPGGVVLDAASKPSFALQGREDKHLVRVDPRLIYSGLVSRLVVMGRLFPENSRLPQA